MILLERLLPVYRPDVVILALFAVNDFDDVLHARLFEVEDGQLVRNRATAETSPKFRYYQRQSFIQTFPGYQWLIAHSQLVNWARQRWARREYYRTFFAPGTGEGEREERAWGVISRLLAAWEERMRQNHIQPLLLFIPSREQVDRGDDGPVDARMDRLTAFGRQRQMLVLDPRPALRKAAEEGEVLYYPKDGHLTLKGHQVLASYLKTALTVHGILR